MAVEIPQVLIDAGLTEKEVEQMQVLDRTTDQEVNATLDFFGRRLARMPNSLTEGRSVIDYVTGNMPTESKGIEELDNKSLTKIRQRFDRKVKAKIRPTYRECCAVWVWTQRKYAASKEAASTSINVKHQDDYSNFDDD